MMSWEPIEGRLYPAGGADRVFKCTSCGSVFDEADAEQSQPDGHYVCWDEPCGDDTLVLATAVEALEKLQ